jgi:hypothetical protein
MAINYDHLLRYNTTIEEDNGALPRHPLLLRHREEGNGNKLPLSSMFQLQHKKR